MIKWPAELISDLARRRTVLFLGSGISRNSTNTEGRKPKTWVAFLERMLQAVNLNRHIKNTNKRKRLFNSLRGN